MAVLSAIFRAVDQLSDVLGSMSDAGASALDQWESSAAAADEAFSRAAEGADRSAQSATEAADAADYWTDAIGNYDKEAMEAIYTTEELVEMGFKTQEALDAERAAAEEAAKALDDLEEQSGDTGDAQEDMGKSGVDAIGAINTALVDAGITKMLQESAAAAYDLATAFSEAESTVILATGASGAALNDMTNSMMTAYAASKTGSLEETAAAVGEINTRMALTGDELTEVTGLFTDFAAVTGGSASGSVRTVTQLMNQWGVEADGLESTLDKLTYAGQAAGISVDTLSSQMTSNKAVLDQLGFSMDEAIAMFSKFELEGTQTASVMTGFRTALSKGAISSLEELYEVFEQIESGAMDASAASDLFGARAGSAIVNAVNSGVFALDDMVAALEETDGVMSSTAEAAQTLDQKWEQAINNINAAFTSAMAPTIEGISSGFAGIVNGFGTFLNEHPAVTKAIVAVGVGVGVVAAGIIGVTFVTTVAIPAVTAFGVALQTAMGPIGWVSLGITAIVAAGAALIAMFQAEETEYDTWTASTKKQYDALQDLNSEYERAVETYGETSEEALRLRYQIDDLNAEFEASKMTVEEFTAQCEALTTAHNDLAQSYADSLASIDSEEAGTMALIQKLGDLASSSEQTAASQMQMESIIESLNASFPDLAISIEDVTQNTDAMVSALKQAAEQQADQERYQENYSTYVDLLKEQAQLEDQIAAAEENIRLEQERMDNMSGLEHLFSVGEYEDLEAYQAALEELQAAYADNIAMQGQCEQAMQDYADAAAEAANATVSYEDAVSGAISSVTDDLNTLAEKYEAAYGAALDSVQGQYALWDEAAAVTATSAGSINSALESQISYWESYNANLANLGDRSSDIEGLSEMLASFADGSSDSVNAVAGMADATDEELAAMVASWQALQEVQGTTADNLAQLETDFDESLATIEERMNAAIDNMNMDTEAAEAAKATIDSYIASIRAGTSEAHDAAAAVASATASALSGTSSPGRGYATGTTYAEPGVHIVGEEGPEAILFNGGETVLNANDTRQYLSGQAPLQTSVPETDGAVQRGGGANSERRIVLELAGRGAIELSGSNFDPDAAAEWLMDNMRPMLMQTLKQEILEEGDGARDF